MLEITVAGEAGHGSNTLASYIARLLYDEGFDVVVSSSDEVNTDFATKERVYSLLKEHVIISINVEQLSKNDSSTN
jgi:hypothetical protein